VFAHRFNQVDWQLRLAQASNNIIGPSPRFAVEALGMILIAIVISVNAAAYAVKQTAQRRYG